MKLSSASLGFVLAVVTFVAVFSAEPTEATTWKSGGLPPCQSHGIHYITPSPAYAQDSTLFLVSSRPGVVWRSNDAGETWRTILDMSRFDAYTFGPIAMVPAPPDPELSLYQSWTYSIGSQLEVRMLWKSSNSGTTWVSQQPSPGAGLINIYPTVDWFEAKAFSLENTTPGWTSSGIWRFTNVTFWVEAWNGTEALFLALSPNFEQDRTLYASLIASSPELGSPVIVSTDGGETWQGAGGEDLCSEGAGSIQISSGFPEDHTLFVHQASSLFRSQDAGETWEVVFPRDRPHCQPGVLAPTADSYKLSSNFGQDHTLYMVTTGPNDDHRLLVSGDGGATWTFQSSVSQSPSLLWVLPAAENRGGSETDDTGNALFAGAMAEGTSASSGLGAAAPKSNWTAFLPLVNWSAAQPTARPFTLFIKARNEMDESTYYRSDDGGLSWACMLLPTVQPPGRTRYLGEGR